MFQSDKIRADNISRSFIPPSLMPCSEGRGGERAQAKGDGPARPPVKEKKAFSTFVHARKREREREREREGREFLNKNNLKQIKQ